MAIYIIYITTMTSMRAILSKTICSTEDVGFKGNGLVKVHFQKYIPVMCCYHPVPCKLDVFELLFTCFKVPRTAAYWREERQLILLATIGERNNLCHCPLHSLLWGYTYLPLASGPVAASIISSKNLPRSNKLHDRRYCSPYSEKHPFLKPGCYL